ncbi:MAG: AAA family ATPase [Ruminiclostridium sp.]|nr:AAA family ATPase [Ruminiclostridium sp.]
MKIKSINISNSKNNSVGMNVHFSDLNVSVLYGENGCGKTTLLRIINAILAKDDSTLLNENVENVEIVFEEGGRENKVVIQLKEVKVKKVNEDGEEEFFYSYKYDWDEFDETKLLSTTSILFGVNRGIKNNISISDEYLYNYIARSRFSSYFRNRNDLREFCFYVCRNINLNQRNRRGMTIKDRFDFSESVLTVDNVEMDVIEQMLVQGYRDAKQVSVIRVQKALFDTLAEACNSIKAENYESEYLKELLLNNKDRLLDTLSQIESNTLSDKIISILSENNIDIIVKECADNSLLTKLIVNMTMELEKEESLLQSVKIVKEIFDEYIGPKKYIEIDEEKVAITFKQNDESHSISELSSGEKHLLVLLTIFVFEGRERDILMIDEPEISLNIKWQRKLMPLLSNLAPTAQIIVASHSPSIAKANSNYLVEMR